MGVSEWRGLMYQYRGGFRTFGALFCVLYVCMGVCICGQNPLHCAETLLRALDSQGYHKACKKRTKTEKREEREEVEESKINPENDESQRDVCSLIGDRLPDAGGRAGGVEAFRLAGDEG